MNAGTPGADPRPNLPPVNPPSGRFIAKLFLVPGLIVAGLVGLVLLGNHLSSGKLDGSHYLEPLKSDNADRRWRAASDLAQTLKRKEAKDLRCDPKFALDLAERLQEGFRDLKQAEEEMVERIKKQSAEDKDKAWRKLAPLRDHVLFLNAALSEFAVPVGVPLLSEIALYDKSPDLKGNTLRRRQAIFALGNLGNSRKEFADLPADQRTAILDQLKSEAAGSTPRASWARTALFYLEPKSASGSGIVRADETLAACARAEDRYLREHVALALNFWDGDQVEPTLLLLSRDDGHGTQLRITEAD